jgi:hypothetical protein
MSSGRQARASTGILILVHMHSIRHIISSHLLCRQVSQQVEAAIPATLDTVRRQVEAVSQRVGVAIRCTQAAPIIKRIEERPLLRLIESIASEEIRRKKETETAIATGIATATAAGDAAPAEVRCRRPGEMRHRQGSCQ